MESHFAKVSHRPCDPVLGPSSHSSCVLLSLPRAPLRTAMIEADRDGPTCFGGRGLPLSSHIESVALRRLYDFRKEWSMEVC